MGKEMGEDRGERGGGGGRGGRKLHPYPSVRTSSPTSLMSTKIVKKKIKTKKENSVKAGILHVFLNSINGFCKVVES